MQRANSQQKTLMLKNTEGQRIRGQQGMRWLYDITDSMDMNFSKLWEIIRTGQPGVLQSMGSQRIRWLKWLNNKNIFSQFSCSVMSESLRPHKLQHARPPCPSPTPGAHPNSCPLSRWCHPTISSSAVPFSSCPQYFPDSGSFQMSQLFTSGGQSIRVSASSSVLPMNTQDWSPLGWTGWISLQSKGLSRVFSNTTVQKH